MRTKTLVLSALLGVASITGALAAGEVYSVNAVGYVNVTIAPGFSMIANPLSAATNTVEALFAGVTGGVPDDTTIYKFSSTAGWLPNARTFGAWDQPNDTLLPGEGVFILNPTTAAFQVTFVGEVPQGNLTNALPVGFSLRSSMVPQAGKLATDLKFPTKDALNADVDFTVYRFNVPGKSAGYSVYPYEFGGWSIEEPVPAVAEGFFVQMPVAAKWVRVFNVNQ